MSVENNQEKRGARPPGGASTFDPFNWSNGPHAEAHQSRTPSRVSALSSDNSFNDHNTCNTPLARPAVRWQQPAGGNSTITFGQQKDPDESGSLLKRRSCSDSKRREMTGSGIFEKETSIEGVDSCANGIYPPDRTSSQCNQKAAGKASQISVGVEGNTSPKKAAFLTELRGIQSTPEEHTRRQSSDVKAKELVGHDIFGPASDHPPRSLNHNSGLQPREEQTAVTEIKEEPRNVRTSVKVSNPAGGHSQIIFGEDNTGKGCRRGHDQKIADLSGNNIFKGDGVLSSSEKAVSVAKLREMSGNDIFADGKPTGRDRVGGIRKPPGGGSSLSLV